MNNLNTERLSQTRKKIKMKIQKIHVLKPIKKSKQIHLERILRKMNSISTRFRK